MLDNDITQNHLSILQPCKIQPDNVSMIHTCKWYRISGKSTVLTSMS